MKKKLLVLGESYMNLQMHTNPVTKDEKTTYGDTYSFHPYGVGATTAISAAKLGADCTFCTKLGDDQNGERLKKYYKSCGIDTSFVTTDKNSKTGMSVTLYSDNQNGHTYISKSANLTLSKKDIEDAFSSCPDMFIVPQDILVSESANSSEDIREDEADTPTEMIDISELAETAPADNNAVKDEEENDFSQTIVFSNKITETENAKPEKEAKKEEKPVYSDPYKDNLSMYAIKLAEEKHVDLFVHYGKNSSKLPLNKINGIKILVISDEALYDASGIFPNSIDKTLRAIIPFAAKIHSKYYVIQQGNDKAFIYDGKYYEIITLPAPLKAKAHQESPRMHGTYIGALAARFLETNDIMDACRYAGVVSIMTRSKFGCLDHAPTRDEVAEFTAEQ